MFFKNHLISLAAKFLWVGLVLGLFYIVCDLAIKISKQNVYVSNIQGNNEYSNIHSATFPIAFVSHFIENFSNTKESIVDLFCGTGTTLVACEQLDRTCYAMELDPKYADVIRKRWAEFKFGEGCDWQALTPAIAKNNITIDSPAEPQSGDQD